MNLSKVYDLYRSVRTNIERNQGSNDDFYTLFQVSGSDYFEYSRKLEYSDHRWLYETLGYVCYHADNNNIVDLLSRKETIFNPFKIKNPQLLRNLEAWWGSKIPQENLTYILCAYFYDSLAKTPTDLLESPEEDIERLRKEGAINTFHSAHYATIWVSYALYQAGEYERAESYLKSFFKNVAYLIRMYMIDKKLSRQLEHPLVNSILFGSAYSSPLTSLTYTYAWNRSRKEGLNTLEEIDMYDQKLNFKWVGQSPLLQKYAEEGARLVQEYLSSLSPNLGNECRLFVPYLDVNDEKLLDSICQKYDIHNINNEIIIDTARRFLESSEFKDQFSKPSKVEADSDFNELGEYDDFDGDIILELEGVNSWDEYYEEF